MLPGEGLQVLLDGDDHLGEAIMHLVGDPAPLLLLGHDELAQQLSETTLAFGKLRSALGYSLLKGLVEVSDLLLSLLALSDAADDGEHEASVCVTGRLNRI